jgi:multisubunit Na+/H+ antiporter MnhG subunit
MKILLRVCFGVVYLLLAVVALACLVPGISPVSILLKIYFGLVYLLMINGIVSTVLDRIALGQEALEALEERELNTQAAVRQEDLNEILASIPPTGYILAKGR